MDTFYMFIIVGLWCAVGFMFGTIHERRKK